MDDRAKEILKGFEDRGKEADAKEEEKIFNELLTKYHSAVCTFKEMQSKNIPDPRPLMGPWFNEGDFGMVFGKRGSGKTWLVDMIAAYLSAGRGLEGWHVPNAVNVLYVDGEMTATAARDRFKGLNPDEDRLHILHHQLLFDDTGILLNFSDGRAQRILKSICLSEKIKVLILDNLSCLFTGVKENDADEWEKILPFLLDMRRMGIAVLMIVHAGRSGTAPRGTSRREDAAFWVIKVEETEVRNPDDKGAHFETSFEKNRNSQSFEFARKWSIQTEADGQVSITCDKVSIESRIAQLIGDGLTSATDIANQLGVNKSTVCRWAKVLEGKGLIEKNGKGQYEPMREGDNPAPGRRTEQANMDFSVNGHKKS
jgi:DNA-binding transcriptional ArsR family regulator